MKSCLKKIMDKALLIFEESRPLIYKIDMWINILIIIF